MGSANSAGCAAALQRVPDEDLGHFLDNLPSDVRARIGRPTPAGSPVESVSLNSTEAIITALRAMSNAELEQFFVDLPGDIKAMPGMTSVAAIIATIRELSDSELQEFLDDLPTVVKNRLGMNSTEAILDALRAMSDEDFKRFLGDLPSDIKDRLGMNSRAAPESMPGAKVERPGENTTLPGLLVLGLNPSWQIIIGLTNVIPGKINRADDQRMGVGGKGQNAAKAAATWLALQDKKLPLGVTVAQFLGGTTGEQIRFHLQSMKIADISATILPPYQTRQTVTLLDFPDSKPVRMSRVSQSMPSVTEIITPTGEISSDDANELVSKIVKSAPEQKGIMLMGTWPSGVSKDIYVEAARAKAEGALVLMDACKPIEEVTSILADGKVDIYKVDAAEICALMGVDEDFKEEEDTLEQIKDPIRRAFEKFPGVKHIAITDGHAFQNAFLFSRDGAEAFRYKLPEASFFLNPIGAGDTVAGVLMATLCSGEQTSVKDAMLDGLAAGFAKVQNEDEGGLFELEAFVDVRKLIECTPFEFQF